MQKKSGLTFLLGLTALTLAIASHRESEQWDAQSYSGKRSRRANRPSSISAETYWQIAAVADSTAETPTVRHLIAHLLRRPRSVFLPDDEMKVRETTTFGNEFNGRSTFGFVDTSWKVSEVDILYQSGAFASKRLTHTSGENIALIKKELSPLAELAAFSIHLLLRSKADKKNPSSS